MGQNTESHAHTRTSDPSGPACVALAIGSNLPSIAGDSAATIRHAIESMAGLPATRLLAASTLHATKAWGPIPQPDYLNAACLIETTLSPTAMLSALHDIERSLGRDRAKEPRFGPRTLDLDIILFGSLILDTPHLTIPHPRMHERPFVLAPLAEIGPDLIHPKLGLSVSELLSRLATQS